ncbi:hypothetical protein [Streptomyces sp. NPDC088789]|uniref:hypothetical protein n=1 Tax=Streptomyces sp. NPDC088789 TaxID=3365899 RepID=UPI00382D3130
MWLRRGARAEESEPYWRQRSWQWSAGFLGIAVVVGGLLALTSPGTEDAGADPARRPAGSGPLAGSAALKDGERPGGCTTDDRAGDRLPEAAPKDLKWREIGIGRVPVSASAGPTRFQDEVWWCFAHTPMGAALAATVIPTQMSEPGWRTVTEQQLVPGDGREMFTFMRSQSPDRARRTDATPASTYVGVSVLAYTREAATVSLLIKGDQGFVATSVEVRWSGGDWKVQAGGDGSLYTEVSAVQDTNSYLLWGR